MSFGKKLGHTLLGLSPLPLSIVVQFILMIPVCGIVFAYCLMIHPDFYGAKLIDTLYDFYQSTAFNTAFLSICAAFIILYFGCWYFNAFEGFSLKPVRLKKIFSPLMILGIFVLALGLQYTVSYIVSFTAAINPDWLIAFEELEDSAGINDMTPLLVLYSVILGPVNEELLFRGVSLSHLHKAMSFWLANIIQAALFGIFHMNMLQGIYAFVLGLFLGYLCKISNSIFPSMLLHIIYNFLACFSTDILSYGDNIILVCFRLILAVLLPIAGIYLCLSGEKKDLSAA
ncbi:MAG: type II CAAX prenyl endopeptidase Rce1 family protein [Roseburia sp.]